MNNVQYRSRLICRDFIWVGLSVLVGLAINFSGHVYAQNLNSVPPTAVMRMTDGRQWTTLNLSVKTVPSYCYEDSEINCLRYGRLYTWESAGRACQALGDGWPLPTDEEWRRLAKHYGGVSEDSEDRGEGVYKALSTGGDSKFDALLGGGQSGDGQYARLQAHGFYGTASEQGASAAWFYNFA